MQNLPPPEGFLDDELNWLFMMIIFALSGALSATVRYYVKQADKHTESLVAIVKETTSVLDSLNGYFKDLSSDLPRMNTDVKSHVSGEANNTRQSIETHTRTIREILRQNRNP